MNRPNYFSFHFLFVSKVLLYSAKFLVRLPELLLAAIQAHATKKVMRELV